MIIQTNGSAFNGVSKGILETKFVAEVTEPNKSEVDLGLI